MASSLPPVPHTVPVLDINGYLHPLWRDWIQKVFIRVGGVSASTNDELEIVTTDRIEDGAVTAAKIAAAVAGNGLTGGAGSALAVNPDGSSIEISSDQVSVKDSGISAAKLASDSVTTGKIEANAVSFIKLLSTDWTNSKAASGYQKLASGVIIQWGEQGGIASGSSTTVSFPTAFPTACRQVIAGLRDNSAASTAATGHWGTGGYSTTGFGLYNRTTLTQSFNWIAIGH